MAKGFGLEPEAVLSCGKMPDTDLYWPVLLWNKEHDEGKLVLEEDTAWFFTVMFIVSLLSLHAICDMATRRHKCKYQMGKRYFEELSYQQGNTGLDVWTV